MRIGDRPALHAADHDSEHGREPDRPDAAGREQAALGGRSRYPPARALPRRELSHGRNALRHEAEDNASACDPSVTQALAAPSGTSPGIAPPGPPPPPPH